MKSPLNPFDVLLLDFFDTVVHFDDQLLPSVELGGAQVRSTLPLLLPLLEPVCPGLDAARLMGAMRDVARAMRREDPLREWPSEERMVRTLTRLGCEPDPTLAAALTRAHMGGLCGAVVLGEPNARALRQLAERWPLVLVSNFDHAPSCRRLLEVLDIAPLFRGVVISGEVGVRKPHPRIFQEGLARAGVGEPARALFVGDDLDADVRGADAAGLVAAWIRPDLTPPPPSPARWVIPSLAELPGVLAAA